MSMIDGVYRSLWISWLSTHITLDLFTSSLTSNHFQWCQNIWVYQYIGFAFISFKWVRNGQFGTRLGISYFSNSLTSNILFEFFHDLDRKSVV